MGAFAACRPHAWVRAPADRPIRLPAEEVVVELADRTESASVKRIHMRTHCVRAHTLTRQTSGRRNRVFDLGDSASLLVLTQHVQPLHGTLTRRVLIEYPLTRCVQVPIDVLQTAEDVVQSTSS